jgi:aryl-phospho-beta-D-glucosidase BglC (GH1 family)
MISGLYWNHGLVSPFDLIDIGSLGLANDVAPSLFENTGNEGIIDEWTFGQYQDYNTARNALVNHWNTWIQEDDIAQIAGTSLSD